METKIFGMPLYELTTDQPIDFQPIRIHEMDHTLSLCLVDKSQLGQP